MNSESIFINVAAYNEEDILDTVKTAFEKASNPKDIYMGILLHYTDKNFPDLDSFANVKTIKVSESIGLGLGISRNLAASLYDGQDYYLQIDGHTVFKKNWDIILKNNYKELKKITDKPIISTYVPYYYRDKETGQKTTMAKNFDWEGYYQPWTLVSKSHSKAIGMEDKERYYLFAYGIEALDTPAAKNPEFGSSNYEEQYFISGHFLFTSSLFLEEIKYDPMLAYHEENVIAMLAWTRGYRIFNIRDHVLWTREVHTFGRDIPNSWKQTYLNKNSEGICFKDKVVLGTLRNKEILTGKVLGEYGAPSIHLLEEYEKAAGLDYKKFYKDMEIMVEKTGNKYPAARDLYELERNKNGK
jgi:hypothetical protein